MDATMVQMWIVSENCDSITAFILYLKKSGNCLLHCSRLEYISL